jgi:hypothetical protein
MPRFAITLPLNAPVRSSRPIANESPSSPCASRWPYGALFANSTSVWIGFQSPVSCANCTTSPSVIVRAGVVTESPALQSSK